MIEAIDYDPLLCYTADTDLDDSEEPLQTQSYFQQQPPVDGMPSCPFELPPLIPH